MNAPRTVWVGGSPFFAPPPKRPTSQSQGRAEREKLLRLIKECPGITRFELGNALLPLSTVTVSSRLYTMAIKGLVHHKQTIERVGPRPGDLIRVYRYYPGAAP